MSEQGLGWDRLTRLCVFCNKRIEPEQSYYWHKDCKIIDLQRCADEALERAKKYEAAILWVLWGHQGGSSPVGQPLRKFLNMGECDDLTAEQVAAAKRFDY